ncbi:MAG: bifunctional riboflavin kinase/FAD synthetase [Erysipelotrichia bacterium]|nr:bifunctional riboflavin kinase/FAD synthetase [Erysipelotrichia bacterium]NCC55104.1 bifunctional riboflavin kinase/FAD synthetase [Erysipelotrichia bacterium]
MCERSLLMEIIRIKANEDVIVSEESIACIGYFDGLHKGHLALIDQVKALANDKCIKAVICFDNDPFVLLHKVSEPRYITPFHERMRKLKDLGIQRCYLLHFDQMMLHMDKEAFIDKILVKLKLKALICGEDFHFAYQGKGDIETLKNSEIAVVVVKEKRYHNEKISSSTLEKLIEQGRMEECYAQLSRPYSIYGEVVHGAHVGSTKLGFPTANLAMEENYIIPKKGVYAGYVEIENKQYPAMINVGHNPTMNYQENTSIEAHILDFNENIYGKKIRFYFLSYLREEKKFSSLEALIEQLHKDVEQVRNR